MTMADNGTLAADKASEDARRVRIQALVEAAREGSTEAINALVTEHTSLLWHVARAAGLSQSDAEDVVQSTWLSLVSHLDRVHTPASLTAWLVTTTKREAWRVRDERRRDWPAGEEWFTAIPDSGAGAEERVIVEDQQRELWAAFSGLPDRCRELLRIVAFVPRPDYDAVAARLGMPRGSVGPTRSRCLEKLRTALYGKGDQR